MRMRILAGIAIAMLALPAAAQARTELLRVDDPSGVFTGDYDCSYWTYDEQGNATKVSRTCTQTGYAAVYDDGVTACNGNPEHARPDNGEPVTGYIWVGPAHAADSPTGQVPGGAAGAGHNEATDDPTTRDVDEAHGPCEDPTPPKR